MNLGSSPVLYANRPTSLPCLAVRRLGIVERVEEKENVNDERIMKDAMDIGEESLSPPTQPMRDSDVNTSAEAGLMTRAAAATVALESTATASASQGKAVATTTSSTAATAADGEDERAPLIEAGFNVEVEEDAAGADQATSTSPQASATAAASTDSSKQNILLFSRGDRPHAKTLCAMTISEPHTTEVEEAMAVDMVEHHRRRESEESDDAPINLAFHPTPAGMVATSTSATAHGLSAKMRLKKQRLEAVAQAAAEMQLSQIQTNATTDSSPVNDHSALHRLAEAAERKQVR